MLTPACTTHTDRIYYEYDNDEQDSGEDQPAVGGPTSASTTTTTTTNPNSEGPESLKAELDYLESFVTARDLEFAKSLGIDTVGQTTDTANSNDTANDTTTIKAISASHRHHNRNRSHNNHYNNYHYQSYDSTPSVSPVRVSSLQEPALLVEVLDGSRPTCGDSSLGDPMEEEHHSSSDSVVHVENKFCKDFHCCGMVLRDMHELLHHYEECHVQVEENNHSHHGHPNQHHHNSLHNNHNHDEEDASLLLGGFDDGATLEGMDFPIDAVFDELEYHMHSHAWGAPEGKLVIRDATTGKKEEHYRTGTTTTTTHYSTLPQQPSAVSTASSSNSSSAASSSIFHIDEEVLMQSHTRAGSKQGTPAPEAPISAFEDSIIRSSDHHHHHHHHHHHIGGIHSIGMGGGMAGGMAGGGGGMGGLGGAHSHHLIRRIGDIEDDLNLRLLEIMEEEMQQDGKRVKLMGNSAHEDNSAAVMVHVLGGGIAGSGASGGGASGGIGSGCSISANGSTDEEQLSLLRAQRKRARMAMGDYRMDSSDEEIDVVSIESVVAAAAAAAAATAGGNCTTTTLNPAALSPMSNGEHYPPASAAGHLQHSHHLGNQHSHHLLSHTLPPNLRYLEEAGHPARDNREDKPYRCSHPGCDKAYKNPNGLKYHNLHGHCEGDEEDADFGTSTSSVEEH